MQCVCRKEYCYKRMGTTLKLIAKSSILTSILSQETKCLEYRNLQKSFNTAAFDIKRQFSQHCSHITFLRSKVDLCHI